MILERIKSPADIKKLSFDEMDKLAMELREVLLKKLSEHGGHIGPNLGTVELEIAMHYVFDSPKDKLVYDVSHQSYIHKMITGRMEAFTNPDKYDDVTGFTEPKESEHDLFSVGHTSTSISLASGLAKARDLKKDNYNVVALIGDGSLSGGQAYEGMDYVVENGSNFIMIVNDNEMSIAPNAGGIYYNLTKLRQSNGEYKSNLFEAIGFEYFYLETGHHIKSVVELLQRVKDCAHPVVLHIHTVKGKGYEFAEKDKERYHAGGPFNLKTGEFLSPMGEGESYEKITYDYIQSKVDKGEPFALISSGTPSSFVSREGRRKLGSHFIDVGIAEEQAVSMVSGMAKNGARPVYMVYSTFLQRAYDQLQQDLCVNSNPAVIINFYASIWGMNDETHLGFFDIAMLGSIPNLVHLAPTCKEEYEQMLKWATTQTEHPVVIKVPSNGVILSGKSDSTDYSILNKFEVTQGGSQAAIIALGDFYNIGEAVAKQLKEKHNITPTLINPKFASGIDSELLDSISKGHKVVITLEDGIIEGGFGQRVSSYLAQYGIRIKNFGLKKEFVNRYDYAKIMTDNGLDTNQIVDEVLKLL